MTNEIKRAARYLAVATIAIASVRVASAQTPLPDAPAPNPRLSAQMQAPVPLAGAPQGSPGQASPVQAPATQATVNGTTIEQAIELAKRNNPTLQANQTLILQNKAQEVTANLRPNPLVSWDTQFLPLFAPSLWSDSNYWETQAQYDIGIGYLFERGRKRQHRLDAAKSATAVTESQVADAERTTTASAAQQFVAALLASSNLEFAKAALESYQRTVSISEDRYKAGAMSKSDLLKIQLQLLQFQTDVSNAQLARAQALASLRQLIGFNSVPPDYAIAGDLAYEPLPLRLEDLQARALAARPDLQAAQRSVIASQSQVGLAKANGKVDLNVSFDYTRLNQSNLGAFYFNIPLPVFNKNQGEIARNQYALTQSQFQEKAAEQAVMTDVKNAYEAARNGERVVQLYNQGALQQAQQSLEITRFSYEHGAASLLDFLDAERSYRATEFSYRQALATYMSALEQLRQAVGSRDLQ
jgi:cobalt-zinc-cadmium efflux system outer membrane protein